MSKKSDGSDINSLWSALLANIKSPSTKAILKLAAPVKITAEEIIITFTSDKLVDQFTNTNKKDIVADAAKVLFNNANTHIVVRLPHGGDNKLQPEAVTASVSAVDEKKKITPENEGQISEESTDITEEAIQELEYKEQKILENNTPPDEKTKRILESDQEKMVLDLFDGKYIE